MAEADSASQHDQDLDALREAAAAAQKAADDFARVVAELARQRAQSGSAR